VYIFFQRNLFVISSDHQLQNFEVIKLIKSRRSIITEIKGSRLTGFNYPLWLIVHCVLTLLSVNNTNGSWSAFPSTHLKPDQPTYTLFSRLFITCMRLYESMVVLTSRLGNQRRGLNNCIGKQRAIKRVLFNHNHRIGGFQWRKWNLLRGDRLNREATRGIFSAFWTVKCSCVNLRPHITVKSLK
jgi:hypothetical protein